MTDRPIIFSAPMVRAMLDGRKSQTRRLLKPQPPEWCANDQPGYSCLTPKGHIEFRGFWPGTADEEGGYGSKFIKLRYAKGDRLWVRESCRAEELDDGLDGVRYAADNVFRPIEPTMLAANAWSQLFHYRGRGTGLIGNPVPSIHMPRWCSRLTLPVTDVRIQRLQEISEADAIAEGLSLAPGRWWSGAEGQAAPNPVSAYALLWNTLHTKPGERWDDDPWIVAISFEVVRGNIDEVAA